MPQQWTSRFEAWPKVELHRHLPGAIRFETWWDIVTENEVALPTTEPSQLKALMTVSGQSSLKEFLRCFDTIDLCFVNDEAIERVTYEAIADAVAEKIIYLELRFSPTRMAQRANISTAKAIEAVISGRQRAVTDFPIEVGLIAGLSREMGVEKCAEEAEIITDYAGRGIAGIDLLGNEADFPAEWFAPIFQPIARRKELGITIHAGEASGAESVRTAVLQLGATRIGHGIRAEEDPAVAALLKERGVTLEICPTSNVQTAATPDLSTHPLARYLRAGIKVTINTDDPQVSQIDLAHEYGVAASGLGLTEREISQTLHYAVEVAFTTEQVKQRLKDALMATISNP
jgi:adenosine deaminase